MSRSPTSPATTTPSTPTRSGPNRARSGSASPTACWCSRTRSAWWTSIPSASRPCGGSAKSCSSGRWPWGDTISPEVRPVDGSQDGLESYEWRVTNQHGRLVLRAVVDAVVRPESGETPDDDLAAVPVTL